jgi:hypothetical protein
MSTTTTEASVPIELKAEDIENYNSIFALLLLSGFGPQIIYFFWIGLLISIWIISGFVAFIASFVCLFYNSSIGDKVAGLVMALFAGPFYWLFYIYNSNYCNKYVSYNI